MAGDRPKLTVAALAALQQLSAVDISSDGRRIAFVASDAAAERGKDPASRVWIADQGNDPRQATRGPTSDLLPRWSPDGSRLAFTSDRDHPGRWTAYLLDFAGEARSVGDIEGSVEDIRWSATGRELLVLAADPGSDRGGAQGGTKIKELGAEQDDPVVVRPRETWRRLYRIDAVTGETSQVSPSGLNVWEIGWAGEGPVVAVVSDDPSESAWYAASIASIDLVQRSARPVYQPEWQLQSPCVSPDGSRAAFVEGFCSDRLIVAGTITVVELATGRFSRLAPELDVSTLSFVGDDRLFYAGPRRLGTMCGYVSLDGSVDEVWSGDAALGRQHHLEASVTPDGSVIVSPMEAPGEPSEVVRLETYGPEREWRQVTRLNRALKQYEYPDRRALCVDRRGRPRGRGNSAASDRVRREAGAARRDRARWPVGRVDVRFLRRKLLARIVTRECRLRRPAAQPAREHGPRPGIRAR